MTASKSATVLVPLAPGLGLPGRERDEPTVGKDRRAHRRAHGEEGGCEEGEEGAPEAAGSRGQGLGSQCTGGDGTTGHRTPRSGCPSSRRRVKPIGSAPNLRVGRVNRVRWVDRVNRVGVVRRMGSLRQDEDEHAQPDQDQRPEPVEIDPR